MNGFPVVVRFPMHWGEMDALGHANNARFLTWFETGRMAYFERIGLGVEHDSAYGPILKRVECDYLRPVLWPAELLVGVRAAELRNTSFTLEYAIALAQAPEVPVARGSTVVVLVNYRSGEKVPISDELRKRIAEVEGH